MTFEKIQKTLGLSTTNNLTADILRLSHASGQTADPGEHDRALREFLLAMLAMVSTKDAGPETATAVVEEVTDRFHEIAQALTDVRSEVGESPVTLH